MPKILVTGGAGFIGSHVVDLFVSPGLGWSRTVALDDGLAETVEYFRTSEKVV